MTENKPAKETAEAVAKDACEKTRAKIAKMSAKKFSEQFPELTAKIIKEYKRKALLLGALGVLGSIVAGFVIGISVDLTDSSIKDDQTRDLLKKMFYYDVNSVKGTLEQHFIASPEKDMIEGNENFTISGLDTSVFEDNRLLVQLLPTELSSNISTFYANVGEIIDHLGKLHNKDRKVSIRHIYINIRENISLGEKIINACDGKRGKGRTSSFPKTSDGNAPEERLSTGTTTVVGE